MTLLQAWTRMTTLLMLPSKAAEEGLHALAIWPWADRLVLSVEPATGTASVEAHAPGAPAWALAMTRHAPQIAGVVLGVTAMLAVASGVRPSTPIDLVLALLLSMWWGKLVAPERAPDNSDTQDPDNGR